MSSSSTHRLGKRSVTLQPAVLAAIIAVVVVFNICVLLGWWLLSRSRRPKKRQSAVSIEANKSMDSVTSYTSTPSRIASKTNTRRKALRNDARTKLSKPRPPPARMQEKITQTQSIGAVSMDSASIYSVASAPLDYHDRLFRTQPFALDPTAPPAAPRWIAHRDPPRAMSRENGPATILQSLMPYPLHHHGEQETISQLLDQIDQLNHNPIASQRSVSSGISVDIAVPPSAHLRGDTAAVAVAPQPRDSLCAGIPRPEGSRSSIAGSSLKVASHDRSEGYLADTQPDTETHYSPTRATQRLSLSHPATGPRIVWKTQA